MKGSVENGPIGIFDSGVGGLTVAHALHTLLPNEQLVYFGDTAHLPYGDKSRESIVKYSLGISDFLLEQKCKVILIACNSASSNAFEEVQAHVGNRAVVMNVIDPVVNHVCVNAGSILDTEGDADRTRPPSIQELMNGRSRKPWLSCCLIPMRFHLCRIQVLMLVPWPPRFLCQ
jgi:hypothetical protein